MRLSPRSARTLVLAAAALAALFALGACAGTGGGGGGEAVATFEVDPSLTPPAPALPPLGGAPRPLAVLETEDGERAAFVADELWLSAADRTAAEALAARWNGEILLEFDPAAAGIGGLEPQFLVRVDPSGADAAGLSADLRELEPGRGGEARVSSADALGLLAAGAAEAVDGREVAVNWVGSGAQVPGAAFRRRSATEAPSGATMNSIPYSPDPFVWPTHDVGSPQDIGVAEAWRALDLAGRLGPSVEIAILDMGFEPDDDTPDGFTAVSNVPAVNPIGRENLLDCGSPCPWHGTNVMSAAFARADNGFGAAGPAGPVAEALLIFTSYDFFTSITALAEARAFGADIANMSYGAPVPDYLAWSVLPFEAATAALRASGMLLFAAAGNDGKNVDAERTAFGVGLGWEKTWYTPCENAGVICVGGLFTNSLARANGSNYGSEQVDIFGPYTLWLGPDPDNPGNAAQVKNGTSFSSPFVAGIAALIWAADPDLDAGSVEDILMETAKGSPDSRVGRVVDALAAVQRAFGNVPPALEVVRPRAGAELQINQSVRLEASVDDFEDDRSCCEVVWSSDVDGTLGEGGSVSATFGSLGPRTLRATATDSGGARTTVEVPITVVDTPPTVEITNPAPGDEVFAGAATVLRGVATDVNEPGGRLACDRLVWTSSEPADGAFPLVGCEVEAIFAGLGERTLTLTGTDPQGETGSAAVAVTVVEAPPNLPPTVRILEPANLEPVGRDEEIVLRGDATDPEGGAPLTLTWTVRLAADPPLQVGTGNNVPWTPSDSFDFSREGVYDVTVRLTVADPEGNVGSDSVRLRFIVIN